MTTIDTAPNNGTALATREFSDSQIRTRLKAAAEPGFGMDKATPALRSLRRTDLDIDAIAARYQSGESSIDIARSLGCSLLAVVRRLRGAGVQLRPRGKHGHSAGSESYRWKGNNVTYAALHIRVRKLRGTPKRCFECGMNDPSKRYEWANLTGRYEDPMDYRRMCVSCHRRYDDKGQGRGCSHRSFLAAQEKAS
jgi:hypothetical protein